ncbi:MAG: hypothetical protein J6K13_04505 [Clostridia bacterium]|nr:hypothetical protein [Clostridia bacterium]
MKDSLSTFLCILLTIALVVGAVCIGAVRGWHGEQVAALEAVSVGSDLSEPLRIRAMDAANLAVVATRHLPPKDPDVVTLQQSYFKICKTNSSAIERAQADAQISIAAESLAKRLPELASVQASQRDQAYIVALTRALSQTTTFADDYTAALEDYNKRLSTSLTGKLAMLLGVEPIPLTTGGN